MNKVVEIKDDLIKEAMQVTGATSEREAIERAVESYVAQHRKSHVEKYPPRKPAKIERKMRLSGLEPYVHG